MVDNYSSHGKLLKTSRCQPCRCLAVMYIASVSLGSPLARADTNADGRHVCSLHKHIAVLITSTNILFPIHISIRIPTSLELSLHRAFDILSRVHNHHLQSKPQSKIHQQRWRIQRHSHCFHSTWTRNPKPSAHTVRRAL